MKEQTESGIGRFPGRHSEGESLAGSLALEGGAGSHAIAPVTATFGSAGWFAARARLFLFVSLLLAVVLLAAPVSSPASVAVGISVAFAPPALPIYVQPSCPGPGFIWIPGYWAWDPEIGYYWVPGTWVLAPFVGALWTPGYWGWEGGVFVWYEGYWGPVIGFYGGINYGFGYTGFGYDGGYWRGNTFYYNRTVNNINVTNITNVYSKSVSNVRPAGASFNGGPGGTKARPTSKQLAAAREKRYALTDAQQQQMRVARADPKQRATENRGRPTIAATTKPGSFTGAGVVRASRAGAPYKAPPPAGKAAPSESARTPKHGADRRVTEPHPAPQQPETARPSPSHKAVPGESARTPKPGAERPPVTTHERMSPGTSGKEPEHRATEPHPAPRQPAAQPSPSREKGGKEEPR